jgi:tyrosine-protein phosphatase SIW14
MWGEIALLAALWNTAPGVPNFHKVNDGLYRGGQPSSEGFVDLAKLGIKTVVDLRIPGSQSNWERQKVESLGMHYIHLPLHGGETPTQADIDRAFSVMLDDAQWPVFVHCREGKDRTGMIIACYRISHDGWTNMRALAEAKSYAFRNIKPAMENYIKQYHPNQPQ